jgi:hypothetical protein
MSDPYGYVTQTRSRPIKGLPSPASDGTVEQRAEYWPRNEGPLVQSTSVSTAKQQTWSYRTKLSGDTEIDPRLLIMQARDKVLRPHDNGHEFHTELDGFKVNHTSYVARGMNGSRIEGPLLSDGVWSFMAKDFDHRYQFGGIDVGQGTKFLEQTRPTKSAANIAQFLLELVVDLPKIPLEYLTRDQAKTQFLKRGSSEYLNIVFGWQPLVSDVLRICRAIVYSDSILQQYKRDSGRTIRRSASNPAATLTNDLGTRNGIGAGWFSYGGVGSLFYRDLYFSDQDRIGQESTTETITEKYWFSGAFSYLFAGDDSFLEKSATYAQLANRVLGARVDIKVLWDIAPWTWLSDWFSDMGAIIGVNNSMAQDNLVIQYGYLMRESHYTRTWTHSGLTFAVSGPTGTLSSTYYRTKKERVRATPYGFGVNPDVFSENQWAILGALGLTKGNRKFWWG